MDAGPSALAPVQRALQSLRDGAGRLLLIAGPPDSGKTELLNQLRGRLTADRVRVIDLKGRYQEREAPYAALAPLARGAEEPTGEPASVPPESGFGMAGLGGLGESEPSSRRARGDRHRGTVLGVAYSTRSRVGATFDAEEYWNRLSDAVRDDTGRPTALLIDDGTLLDPASRDAVLALGARAPLGPLLVVVVLNSGEPAVSAWEERLLGRTAADWVRLPSSRADPRESHRLKVTFEGLPKETQRVLAIAALLGGATTEVVLSRVTRLTFGQLGDALLPATESRVVRVDGEKITIPHGEWSLLIPELLPAARVRELHREIAEALEAMNPEPTLGRRVEVAHHFFQWERGPMALRFLLEAAELMDRVLAFDSVVQLLGQGLECVPSLPEADRASAEVELRFLLARAMLLSGRCTEAETELREAVSLGLDRHVAPEALEEWIEPLLPALAVVGPRPSLIALLAEVADRFHDAGQILPEVLFQSVVASHEHRRGRGELARREAFRALHRARGLPRGLTQAVALLAVGTTRSDGGPEEREVAAKFFQLAATILGEVRRTGLQQWAEELRLEVARPGPDAAATLDAHARAIGVLQRTRLHSLELGHHLAVAEILLERKPGDPRIERALKRAREIVDLLRLAPPTPGVYRLWLGEARTRLRDGEVEEARVRLRALADRPAPTVPSALRLDATLRLVELELGDRRAESAQRYFEGLPEATFPSGRRPSWEAYRAQRTAPPRAGPGAVPPAAVEAPSDSESNASPPG